MDWGNIAQILSAFVSLLALVIALANRRTDKSERAITAMQIDIDSLQTRMHSTEERLRYVPNIDAVHQLDKTMVELQGKLDVITAQLQPLSRISDRLQEFLLQQANNPRPR
jgi:predicted  nucleic acid-binding Zn-ribbon protein